MMFRESQRPLRLKSLYAINQCFGVEVPPRQYIQIRDTIVNASESHSLSNLKLYIVKQPRRSAAGPSTGEMKRYNASPMEEMQISSSSMQQQYISSNSLKIYTIHVVYFQHDANLPLLQNEVSLEVDYFSLISTFLFLQKCTDQFIRE